MAEPWYFEVLPCRPRPYADECLSGYLVRLAGANRIRSLWTLASDLFPRWQGTQSLPLLRWEYPVEAWGLLPLRTQLEVATLNQLTVLAWVAKFRRPPSQQASQWQGPGHFLSGIIMTAHRACPHCLEEAAYLRLSWRLKVVEVCLAHGCLLQEFCQGCGAPLYVGCEQTNPFCCPRCGADWRGLSVIPAAEEVLIPQRQQQANVRYLLDPTTRLAVEDPAATNPERALPEAVGLKFRQFRLERGQSVVAMARQVGVTAEVLADLERGKQVPLPLYGRYLDTLGLTWPEVSARTLTPEMVEQMTALPHRELRQCPNPTCEANALPPGLPVTILQDLPEQRVVRLRCRRCGKSFTRSYDGHLTSRVETRTVSMNPAHWLKSAEELAQLIAWGREGKPNRWIGQQLGWGQKTVRTYWLRLEIAEEVHQAQARRRRQAQDERRSRLHDQIEAVLPELLSDEQELCLGDVAEALGFTADYFTNEPRLRAELRERLMRHNAEVRAGRDAAVRERIQEACAGLSQRQELVTHAGMLAEVGFTWVNLRNHYPELAAQLHAAVEEHQQGYRAARRAEQLAQIDAAAQRLSARGVRLTQKAILREAGIEGRPAQGNVIRQRLQHWVGDFPWNE